MCLLIKLIQTSIQYRDLIWNLAVKDLKAKYRTPNLGFLWAVITPLGMVFIFKFVFSTFIKTEIEHWPFFIYLMTAIFPWTYSSSSVNASVDCISNNRELIKKIYFPREIIPISVVLENFLNFVPVLFVMLVILFIFKQQFTPWILLVPFIIILQTIFTLGLVFIIASFQVFIRDIKYIIELLLMLLFYLSPTFYALDIPISSLGKYFMFYLLNPFVGIFILYRVAFLKGYLKTLPGQINLFTVTTWTIMVTAGLFLIGLSVFKKYEPRFFDLI